MDIVDINYYLSKVLKNEIMAEWTVALDKEGKRINIGDAPAHEKYTCINCGGQMMARKGILSKDVLTEYETHIDMPAVIQSFNVTEFPVG